MKKSKGATRCLLIRMIICSGILFSITIAAPPENPGPPPAPALEAQMGVSGEYPPNKYDTSDRFARSAPQKVYGFKETTACPLYTQHPIGNILYNKDGQPVGPFSAIGYGPEKAVDPAVKLKK